jgi:hypothetical protein
MSRAAWGGLAQVDGHAAADDQHGEEQDHTHHRTGQRQLGPSHRELAGQLKQQEPAQRAEHPVGSALARSIGAA